MPSDRVLGPWRSFLAEIDDHKRHKLYVQIASVATLPYEYAGRFIEVFAGEFEHLRLLVVDRYDLALSKLPRNLDVDFEDVKHLARSPDFDLGMLKQRYYAELRPYVSGPPERHDLTLKLWIEAITEESASGHP